MSARGVDPEPTEEDYTRAAEDALHRGDLRLALVQLGGALSYRPNAPELRALLDLALTRARDPLGLLPHTGSAFFGVGAVRAAAFARSGELGKAIPPDLAPGGPGGFADRVVRGGAGATYLWQNPGEWQAMLTAFRQRAGGLLDSIGVRPVRSVG